MWVFFTAYFQWTPPEEKRVRIAYKKDHRYFVRRQCGADAIAAGKAVKAKRPERAAENVSG